MGQRIAGTATVRVDGNQFALKGNMHVRPSAVERKGIAGQDFVHGYHEAPIVPSIEGDFSLIPGLSLEDVELITDATVQADLANGTTYVLRGAWCVSAFDVQSGEGQVSIKFEGLSCDEVTA